MKKSFQRMMMRSMQLFSRLFGRTTIYLDHAATTPMDPEVQKVLVETQKRFFANPGGLHAQSRSAKELLDVARARVAKVIGMQPADVVFTRGGTESDVMALWAIIKAHGENVEGTPHVIISSIEHSAVRESVYAWEAEGLITVSELPVDTTGVVDPQDLKNTLRPETILVSAMYVNNEIGSIQPIRELTKTVRWWRKQNDTQYPYVHTDAIQATNYLDIHMPRLGVDLMSLSGSKIYGPKSIGTLCIRPNVEVAPLMHGGSQESDLRPGTEDVAGCVAFALALEMTIERQEDEAARLESLKSFAYEQLDVSGIEYRIHGSREDGAPHILNLGIKGMSGERLVIELDAQRISTSSRAACATNAEGASHVIAALGYHDEDTWGTLRISMGRSTTQQDTQRCIQVLKKINEKIQDEQKYQI